MYNELSNTLQGSDPSAKGGPFARGSDPFAFTSGFSVCFAICISCLMHQSGSGSQHQYFSILPGHLRLLRIKQRHLGDVNFIVFFDLGFLFALVFFDGNFADSCGDILITEFFYNLFCPFYDNVRHSASLATWIP